jgi:hypothetical protein
MLELGQPRKGNQTVPADYVLCSCWSLRKSQISMFDLGSGVGFDAITDTTRHESLDAWAR